MGKFEVEASVDLLHSQSLFSCVTQSVDVLTLEAPKADQPQSSPLNLQPAVSGTVWRIWQVISC